MPGEIIAIDPEKYPDLTKIDDGEQVSLKVVGTKNTNEDGQIEITTDSIEQINLNPAKEQLKSMMPKQKKMMPAGDMEMEEEY